jgi:hypothetical protein
MTDDGALDLQPFREVWCVDFEFVADDGEQPKPVCMVARELRTQRLERWWRGDLDAAAAPPYPTADPTVLFVAYYASAELGCHLALNWPVPRLILDLFVEFRAITNGLPTVAGNGLLGAMAAFNLTGGDALEKDSMRALVMSGGPWSCEEQVQILDYCQSDVDALARLLPAMLPKIDLPRALLRGRSMAATARMEWAGVPVDVGTLCRMQAAWPSIKNQLIADIDQDYGIYEGTTFKYDRFAAYLAQSGIPWPYTANGRLDLRDDTFRQQARGHPLIAPLHNLRHALGRMRLAELAVGGDGRNRTLLSPFRSKTGRNQPSNSRFIFGPSTWLRSLIRPPPGHGLAYIDYSSQEIGIAAALSRDENLIDAYVSGDPYLAFAKLAKLAPPEATKASHGDIRDICKAVVLGVNYGMGDATLANQLGIPPFEAKRLLETHRKTFPVFWRWSDGAVTQAMLHGRISTVFGWPIHVGANANPRALMNFPMQANGAEILRLACCLMTEAGIEVCAPVHDAVLILAPLTELEARVRQSQECMAEAGRIVLGGFELRTDAEITRHPDRYSDKRGVEMWDRVMGLLSQAGDDGNPQTVPHM